MITGKEAKQAWANGESVQIECAGGFFDIADHREFLNVFDDPANKFRLKPRTISLNNIEVPAPFEPKDDCLVYILDDSRQDGFREYDYDIEDTGALFFGVWRTKEEIKQVVAALRSIFK